MTWRTDTYWFDVAVVMTFLMLGQLFLGRFSEYQPRSRRLLKSVIGVVLLIGVAVSAGRGWMFVLLGAMLGALRESCALTGASSRPLEALLGPECRAAWADVARA